MRVNNNTNFDNDKDFDKKLGYKRATGQYMTSSARALFREALGLVLPNLVGIGKGDIASAPHSAQVRAVDIISKYAIGERPIMMFEKKEWLAIVARVTAKYITDSEMMKAWQNDMLACFLQQQ